MSPNLYKIYLIVDCLDKYLSAIIDKNNAPDRLQSYYEQRELPQPILGQLVAASHSTFVFSNIQLNDIKEI